MKEIELHDKSKPKALPLDTSKTFDVIGKAREIYTQLSLEQSSNYDKVKELILKGYELVPEAYRQKFRDCRKEHDILMWNLQEQKSNYLIGGALQRK